MNSISTIKCSICLLIFDNSIITLQYYKHTEESLYLEKKISFIEKKRLKNWIEVRIQVFDYKKK